MIKIKTHNVGYPYLTLYMPDQDQDTEATKIVLANEVKVEDAYALIGSIIEGPLNDTYCIDETDLIRIINDARKRNLQMVLGSVRFISEPTWTINTSDIEWITKKAAHIQGIVMFIDPTDGFIDIINKVDVLEHLITPTDGFLAMTPPGLLKDSQPGKMYLLIY